MHTTYYLPSNWRSPVWYYRLRRHLWLWHWRRQGFASYAKRYQKRFISYRKVDDYRVQQGIGYAWLRRTRQEARLVVSKPRLTDAAIDDVIGARD
jgi:hypothetical protein